MIAGCEGEADEDPSERGSGNEPCRIPTQPGEGPRDVVRPVSRKGGHATSVVRAASRAIGASPELAAEFPRVQAAPYSTIGRKSKPRSGTRRPRGAPPPPDRRGYVAARMKRTWTLIGLTAAVTLAAGIAHYTGAPALLTFVIATLALAGLAWVVSFATEQVGERFGPAVTGVLQSTLGNLPEFFIVIFALSAGELVVARTAISARSSPTRSSSSGSRSSWAPWLAPTESCASIRDCPRTTRS